MYSYNVCSKMKRVGVTDQQDSQLAPAEGQLHLKVDLQLFDLAAFVQGSSQSATQVTQRCCLWSCHRFEQSARNHNITSPCLIIITVEALLLIRVSTFCDLCAQRSVSNSLALHHSGCESSTIPYLQILKTPSLCSCTLKRLLWRKPVRTSSETRRHRPYRLAKGKRGEQATECFTH